MIADSDFLEQKKSKVPALAVSFLFLFFISALIYFEITSHGSNPSTCWPGPYTPIGVTPKKGADSSVLRADLESYTTLEKFNGGESWGREGTIHIEGWIYNDGNEDVNVTLFIHVTDGTKSVPGMNMSEFWQDYYFPMGVVPKNGGRKWFDWKQRYNPFDPTTATFFYRLLITI